MPAGPFPLKSHALCKRYELPLKVLECRKPYPTFASEYTCRLVLPGAVLVAVVLPLVPSISPHHAP